MSKFVRILSRINREKERSTTVFNLNVRIWETRGEGKNSTDVLNVVSRENFPARTCESIFHGGKQTFAYPARQRNIVEMKTRITANAPVKKNSEQFRKAVERRNLRVPPLCRAESRLFQVEG